MIIDPLFSKHRKQHACVCRVFLTCTCSKVVHLGGWWLCSCWQNSHTCFPIDKSVVGNGCVEISDVALRHHKVIWVFARGLKNKTKQTFQTPWKGVSNISNLLFSIKAQQIFSFFWISLYVHKWVWMRKKRYELWETCGLCVVLSINSSERP